MGNNLDKVNADLNRVFNKILEGSPDLAGLFGPKDPAWKFPEGLRYHYYSLPVGRRSYMFCYSTTRNANHKFLSWVYKPYWKLVRTDSTDKREKYKKVLAWTPTKSRETRKYKSAKGRAWKMFESKRAGFERSKNEKSKAERITSTAGDTSAGKSEPTIA